MFYWKLLSIYCPPPKEPTIQETRALLIDSWYNSYLGIICLVRVFDGALQKGQKFRFVQTKAHYIIDKLAVSTPSLQEQDMLQAGEVGVVISNIKTIADCSIGDTLTLDSQPTDKALPGFKPSEPVVFCSIFPSDPSDYTNLRDAMDKLQLNDSSFTHEADTSGALGFGFRCGFLGLLHLEIIQERIMREFDIDIIATAPSVVYHIYLTNGTMLALHNPSDMPDPVTIKHIEEPWIRTTIMVPDDYLGNILTLCTERRGIQKNLTYVGNRAMLVYDLPLNETIFDFHDKLKSLSRGYASFNYEITNYQINDLVKVSVLINNESVEALAMILHRTNAEKRGRQICLKLKDVIPRQLFKVPIQAAIGGKIIARETIAAMRKDVLAKCYGGDVSRKRKLLEKQKQGKKKMRQFGKVDVPHSAFLHVLKMNDD